MPCYLSGPYFFPVFGGNSALFRRLNRRNTFGIAVGIRFGLFFGFFTRRTFGFPVDHQVNVCQVVLAVPDVQGDGFLQLHGTFGGRMVVSFFQIVFLQGFQEICPAFMQGSNEFNGSFDGSMFSIFQFGPQLFFVGFNDGRIFRNSQFYTNICIDVAVCDVVYYLSDSPAVGAVGFFQFAAFQFFQGVFEILGKLRQNLYVLARIVQCIRLSVFKLANGISEFILLFFHSSVV